VCQCEEYTYNFYRMPVRQLNRLITSTWIEWKQHLHVAGGWLSSKRNYIILLYAISFSLVSVDLMIAVIYLELYFSSSISPEVVPYPLSWYVTNLPGSPFTESLSMAFEVFSLCSFLIMWIATSIFLSQYRYKLGKIKYFSLISIPLLYYIFPFQNYFGDAFFSLIESSPVSFSIIYILKS
jgi:hypothetical protein